MRIRWLLARRDPDVPSPLVLEVSRLLRRRGHDVDAVTCEAQLEALDVDARARDLYLLKSHTELALSWASALELDGATVLNGAVECRAAQDKLVATRRLAAAGVPVPRTHVTGCWSHVAVLAGNAPVLVKPLRGHRGAGVEVVTRPEQVAGRPEPTTPLVVQEVVPGPGEDLKVYVVGTRVWAVRKPFSPRSFAEAGRPVAVTADVARLARTVAAVSGLSLFGIDVIESPSGPVVVDLNYLPGYKGCVGVAEPMASLVHHVATRRDRGRGAA